MNLPKLIVIVGPTASGKTDLAIEIAKQVDGEIIQADSRTIYCEMNIGTGKPDYPHFGIDLVNPDEDFTVAEFKAYAEEKIFEMVKRGKVPILAGGTGLYVSAIVNNLDLTDAPPNLELRRELESLSDDDLRSRLERTDPEAFASIDVQNRRRLLRAIEIVESTGKSLNEQQTKGKPKFDVLMIGIDIDRKVLNDRINRRVDRMIESGLVDEVKKLKEKYGCEVNAMTGIGYRQMCSFLDGSISLKESVEEIKHATRQYAKRQMTWWRRDVRIKWIKTNEEAAKLVNGFLGV